MFRNFLKEYFSFSLATRRGIWVLIFIIFIFFIIPYVYSLFIPENNDLLQVNTIKDFEKAYTEIKTQDTSKWIARFPFNPNHLSKAEWIKMGVSSRTVENIEKYIRKGGKFRKKNDILKIYGFDSALYLRLSSLFVFEQDTSAIGYCLKSKKTKKSEIRKLELNSADTFLLDKLPGIGKTLSARIIKYRNMLGGFYNPEQLMEVYNLNENVFDLIKNKIEVDSNLIKKIDLNQVSEMQLTKHPYIGKYKALAIVKYRNYKKKISNYNELIENGILSKQDISILKYYLK